MKRQAEILAERPTPSPFSEIAHRDGELGQSDWNASPQDQCCPLSTGQDGIAGRSRSSGC